MINLFQLQLDDVLWNGDILPFKGPTDHRICIVNIRLQIINQNCRSCFRMDGQTLVMIFSNNVNSGPLGKFLHLLRSKQTTLAYDVLDFSLILSYVVPKGLSFCPVASGHWTCWIRDTCPRLDTGRVSNVSNGTSHWTETKTVPKSLVLLVYLINCTNFLITV